MRNGEYKLQRLLNMYPQQHNTNFQESEDFLAVMELARGKVQKWCLHADFEKKTAFINHGGLFAQGMQQGSYYSSNFYSNNTFLLTLRRQLSVGNLIIFFLAKILMVPQVMPKGKPKLFVESFITRVAYKKYVLTYLLFV